MRIAMVSGHAGPTAVPGGTGELLPFMPESGDRLARLRQRDMPDIAHAHFWMSGLTVPAGTA